MKQEVLELIEEMGDELNICEEACDQNKINTIMNRLWLTEGYSKEDIEEAMNFTLIKKVAENIELDHGTMDEFIVLKDNRTGEIASYGFWSFTSQSGTLTAYETPIKVKKVTTYEEI